MIFIPIFTWLALIVALYCLAGYMGFNSELRTVTVPPVITFTDQHGKEVEKLPLKAYFIGGLTVVVGASLVLLVAAIALHRHWVVWLFTGIVAFNCGNLVAVTLNPQKRRWQLIAGYGLAVCLFLLYALYPNWLTSGILSTGMILNACLMFKWIRLRTLIILTTGLFIFDAIHVFGTGLMMEAATGDGTVNSPIMYTIPNSTSLHAEMLFGVGLGDILIPGFLLMLSWRLAYFNKKPIIVVSTLLGILGGHLLALLAVVVTLHPQPALIYLVPCTWLGLGASTMWRRHELKDEKDPSSEEEDEEASDGSSEEPPP